MVAKEDSYNWVNFSFYPCPVGADTPAGCPANPGPFAGVNKDCCYNDKFEACMVSQFQCFLDSPSCNNTLRHQMANFLSCFEGGDINEGQCPGVAETCMATAGLSQYYPTIMSCYNDEVAVQKASEAMNATCTKENPQSWPHVRINGKLMCEDDSCFMPLLPKLCAAYKSTPKPNSCLKLEAAAAVPAAVAAVQALVL